MEKKYIKPMIRMVMLQTSLMSVSGGDQGTPGDHGQSKVFDFDDEESDE